MWIDINDKKPKDGQEVIFIGNAIFKDGQLGEQKITHWMPLPENPLKKLGETVYFDIKEGD